MGFLTLEHPIVLVVILVAQLAKILVLVKVAISLIFEFYKGLSVNVLTVISS